MLAAALLALAILLVGLASAVEVAVFALAFARVQELATSGKRTGRALAALRSRPAILLATLWTARTLGVALAALGAWWVARLAADAATEAAIVAVALAVLLAVLAEFAGKTLAQHDPETFSLAVSVPTWMLSRALLVLSWPAELIVRLLAPKSVQIMPGISDRQIRDLVNHGSSEPVIEEHERRLIERALLLDQTTAYDVMTPRVDILAWPETQTLAEIAPELRAARYSRVPLYNGSIDKITGVLHVRDAYQALISGQRDVQLKALAREPFFVPGSVTLDKLLVDFQARRIQIGIVIDEYGGVDGLIALEDILEELVGEIIDESDVAQEPITRLSRTEILVDGTADLREINHFFNTTFPQLEYRSLNGYLLDMLGRVPQPGEKITREGVVIEVTAATETQMLRARLTRQAASVSGTESEGGAAPDEPAEVQGQAVRQERAPARERRPAR
ncbi:MAG: HlyC/CorC family transporter [Gemmatimonadota bacterium]|nr:MAG: HlyC/CorC family transporter [Gemmatimonadota bacterium]